MKVVADDRAVRYIDVFPRIEGQINVSIIPPHRLVAWHKHHKQRDYWMVLQGTLKVGIVAPDGTHRFETLTLRDPKVLEIPEEHWHGYLSLEEETILLYWVTRKYDPADEIRATVEELGVSWATEVK